MATQRRLGRGLDALLGGIYDGGDDDAMLARMTGESPVATNATAGAVNAHGGDAHAAANSSSEMIRVPVGMVEPNPYQPRRNFDPLELASLVESIQQHGVIQPIAVRKVAAGWQLIAGERRLRAAQEAGLAEILARVIEAADQQVFELAIVENLQRTDLNAIEKARAFRDYLDRFGCTQDELAGRLALDRSTVSNFVRLLELPAAIQKAVEAGKLSQGHARALLVVGDSARQHDLCQRIIRDGLSVRQVESLVAADRPAKSKGKSAARPNPHATTHVAELEAALRERLGTQVEIRLMGKECGHIVIAFATNDDFERIATLIRGESPALRVVAA